mgnify:CR=1 FL=1
MSDSLEHIQHDLWQHITAAIKDNNGLPFVDFMRMALYQPGLGYYSAGLKKFGQAGDFITAVELGSLFAQSLARQFAEVMEQLEQPIILELGAGSGRFCADTLTALDGMDSAGRFLPTQYLILEVSAGNTTMLCSKIILNPQEKTEIKAPKKGEVVTKKEYNEIITKKMQEFRENRGRNRGGSRGGRS